MTIHYLLILIISLLFVSIRLFSQEVVKLSGAVIDADNQPVELALVRIAGTTTGTTTNLEGKYELKINSADSVLVVFSCLGFINEVHLL